MSIVKKSNSLQLHKFGGSSLADIKCYHRVLNIILKYTQPGDIIVVSASGKTTNLLISLLEESNKKAYKDIKNLIYNYHTDLIKKLLGDCEEEKFLNNNFCKELEKIFHILLEKKINIQMYSKIIAYGEVWSARLINTFLNNKNIKSTWIDSREFLYAEYSPLPIINQKKSSKILNKLITNKKKKRIIITGFISRNEKGNTVLLGRNGSDYSATQIGSMIPVNKITIWSDVAGIYSADPKQIKKSYLISFLNLKEANELARLGAPVLHTRTLQPILNSNINLEFKSSYNLDLGSTKIERTFTPKNRIITNHKNIYIINVQIKQSKDFKKICKNIFDLLKEDLPLAHNINVNQNLIQLCYTSETYAHVFKTLKKFNFQSTLKSEKGFGLVALVGKKVCYDFLNIKIFQKISQKFPTKFISKSSKSNSIVAVMDKDFVLKFTKDLHDSIFFVKKRIGIVLFGKGNIASTWLKLFSKEQISIIFRTNYEVILSGVISKSYMLLNFNGLNPNFVLSSFEKKALKKDEKKLISWMCKHPFDNLIILDITASKSISKKYCIFAKFGFHVISANKINSGNTTSKIYSEIINTFLFSKTYWLSNATVGAGLPVNYAIQNLRQSGDFILSFSGIFSGTLSWLFSKYDGTIPFSKLVYTAWKKGLTEPDPRIDLSGEDVVRKLIILARESGYNIQPESIKSEKLVSIKSQSLSLDKYWKTFDDLDNHILIKFKLAKKTGSVLRYVARFNANKKETFVGIESVSPQNPLFFLSPGDNIFCIHSLFYKKNPLIIQGPGAGKQVTAGAIQSDINKLIYLLNKNYQSFFNFN